MNKLLYIIVLIVVFFTPSCDQRRNRINPSGRSIKIGVIAPLSGPDQKSGEAVQFGIRTALQMQPLLENGDQVKLVIEDNGGAGQNTLSALQKLHSMNDVAGVLLMAKSNDVLQLTKVADEYGIPILALIATHPDITLDNHFITQLGFDDNHQGTVAALYVRDEMLMDRIAVISDQANAHYNLLTKAFIREFTMVGGEIVEHITSFPQTSELSNILTRLQDQQVQLLYLALPPEQVMEVARMTHEIDWKPKMMGSDGLMATIILEHKNDISLINGMIATDLFSPFLPKTEYGRKAVLLTRKFSSDQQTSYSALGCEGTSLLLNALNRCSSGERSCVNQMLRDTNGFEGVFGKITINSDGKTERPVIVNVIENGSMKFIVKVY